MNLNRGFQQGMLSSQLKSLDPNTINQIPEFNLKTENVRSIYEVLRKKYGIDSEAVVIFSTFLMYLDYVSVDTVMELENKLHEAIQQLKEISTQRISVNLRQKIAIEIFQHQVEQTADRFKDRTLTAFKSSLIKMCSELKQQAKDSMHKVSDKANLFIKQDYNILLHGNSMTVFKTIEKAIARGLYFNVYITFSSTAMARALVEYVNNKKISCTAIPGDQVAQIMMNMDMVMLGAESVTILGGVINTLGSYQMCLVAQALRKRVYILTDRFKFSNLSPLTQNDIPQQIKHTQNLDLPEGIKYMHYSWDYTPCQYIDFYITDVGVVVPKNIGNLVRKIYNLGGAK